MGNNKDVKKVEKKVAATEEIVEVTNETTTEVIEGNVVEEELTEKEKPVISKASAETKTTKTAVVEESHERMVNCVGLENHKCSIGDQKRIIIEKNKPISLRIDVAMILQRSNKVYIKW